MILKRFATLIPGKTYKKKLYYWNWIQYIVSVWIALLIYPIQVNPIGWWIYITVVEFFTPDTHIYGDLAYILTGQEIRWFVWVPTILIGIGLVYLWAYKNNKIAKYLRIGSWVFTLLFYLIWTLFFYWREDYDYAVWAGFITTYWSASPILGLIVFVMAIISLSAMWFGVIISNGYLIYKGWKED